MLKMVKPLVIVNTQVIDKCLYLVKLSIRCTLTNMDDQNKRSIDVIFNVLPPDLIDQATIREDELVTTIDISLGAATARIQPRWAGQGFPRDLDLAIAKLPDRSTGEIVFTAVAFSPGSRERLKEQGFSWADETGRAHLEVKPGLYVLRDSRAVAVRRSRPIEDTWNQSIGAVAETILVEALKQTKDDPVPHVLERIEQLSARAAVSPSQTVTALQMFDRAGYTIKSGAERGPTAKRTLIEPGDLLSAWAGWQPKQHPRIQGMHVLWEDVHEFIEGPLARALNDRRWAITGWLAADAIAPYATPGPSFSAYIDPALFDRGLRELAAQIGLRTVDSGARVTFIRAEEHILNQSSDIKGVPYVSPIRLYRDLSNLGVRGDDAASHLRETQIGW